MRIVDVDGVDRTAALPELAGTAVRVAARSAILDGELVVVDADGRADPEALAARLAGDGGRQAAFLAFDLLHLDGRSLLNQPLVKRREALRRILRPGDEVLAVPAIATEGRALFEAIVAQGLAGMMARQRQGPYLPGTRSRLWRFIPARAGVRHGRRTGLSPGRTGGDGLRDGTGPRDAQPAPPRRRRDLTRAVRPSGPPRGRPAPRVAGRRAARPRHTGGPRSRPRRRS